MPLVTVVGAGLPHGKAITSHEFDAFGSVHPKTIEVAVIELAVNAVGLGHVGSVVNEAEADQRLISLAEQIALT